MDYIFYLRFGIEQLSIQLHSLEIIALPQGELFYQRLSFLAQQIRRQIFIHLRGVPAHTAAAVIDT